MGASLIVVRSIGVVGVDKLVEPYEVLVALLTCLNHNRVTWEVRVVTSTCLRIYTTIEAIVESPIDVTIGKSCGQHAIATVPAECTGKHLVVLLILVYEYTISLTTLIIHQLKTPLRAYSWRSQSLWHSRTILIRYLLDIVLGTANQRCHSKYDKV